MCGWPGFCKFSRKTLEQKMPLPGWPVFWNLSKKSLEYIMLVMLGWFDLWNLCTKTLQQVMVMMHAWPSEVLPEKTCNNADDHAWLTWLKKW